MGSKTEGRGKYFWKPELSKAAKPLILQEVVYKCLWAKPERNLTTINQLAQDFDPSSKLFGANLQGNLILESRQRESDPDFLLQQTAQVEKPEGSWSS